VQINSANASTDQLGPFGSAWHHRDLLSRLVQRDVETRFRGSVLGKVWAFLVPLVMLGLYTFVFGVVIQPRWQDSARSNVEIALTYFSGLILFDFVFECISRAPTLMQEHVNYIKKVVFPLDILAWMVLFGGAFKLAIGSVMLLLFYLFLAGLPPLSALFVPVILLPLALFAVGFVWFLSAFGVYIRDIKQVIGIAAPVAMFLSPVFFPLSAVPERFQKFFYVNPLTYPLESIRAALFAGHWTPSYGFGLYVVVSWLFAWLGFRTFVRLRSGFADVL
jgi:lipopolysaccharide transport system permease protein